MTNTSTTAERVTRRHIREGDEIRWDGQWSTVIEILQAANYWTIICTDSRTYRSYAANAKIERRS